MKTTRPPEAGAYQPSGLDKASPNIPAFVNSTIEARKQVTELDRQLKAIRNIDNTRQAFSDFY